MKPFFDTSGRLNTFWRFAIFLTGITGIYVADILALDAAFSLGRSIPNPAVQSFITSFYMSPMILYLDIALRAAASTGLVLICRRYLDHRPLRSLGFVPPGGRPFSAIHTGFLLGFLPVIGVSLLLLAAGELLFVTARMSWDLLSMVPLLAVAAFYEEIVCRGYLFQNFLDIRQPLLGVAVTSVLFWLMHGFNDQVWSSPIISLNLFLGGVTLALAYRVSGNIWFPAALHMGWNYAQGGVLGLPISGETLTGLTRLAPGPTSSRLLTGGSFGLEGSILLTGCEIGVIALFLRSVFKESGKKQKGHIPEPLNPRTLLPAEQARGKEYDFNERSAHERLNTGKKFEKR